MEETQKSEEIFNEVSLLEDDFTSMQIDKYLKPDRREWSNDIQQILEKKCKIKCEDIDFEPGSPIERCLDGLPENTTLNILVIGRTGEGKSTLINTISGKFACPTSDGYKSKTNLSHGITFTKRTKKIVLWDTEGHKEDPQLDILREAHRSVITIHKMDLVFWVQSATNYRFEGYLDEELPVYRKSWRIPVWLVLTKISEEQLEEHLDQWQQNLIGAQTYVDCIIPTAWLSKNKPPSQLYIKRLNDLMDRVVTSQISKRPLSLNINTEDDESNNNSNEINESTEPKIIDLNPTLPDDIYDDDRAESINENMRRELILKYFLRSLIPIAIAIASATAVGCSPVPFSDWILLVPIQLCMMAGISYAYKLQITKGSLLWLLGSSVTAIGGTLIGKFGLSLLKLVPGINIPVMAIDGVFSGFWTLAMGLAYSTTLRGLLLKGFDLSEINEDLVKILATEVTTGLKNNLTGGYTKLKERFNEEVKAAEDDDPEIAQSIKKSLKEKDNMEQKQRKRNKAEDIKSEQIILLGKQDLCVLCRERQPQMKFETCEHQVVCKICWEDKISKRTVNFCPVCNGLSN